MRWQVSCIDNASTQPLPRRQLGQLFILLQKKTRGVHTSVACSASSFSWETVRQKKLGVINFITSQTSFFCRTVSLKILLMSLKSKIVIWYNFGNICAAVTHNSLKTNELTCVAGRSTTVRVMVRHWALFVQIESARALRVRIKLGHGVQ